jgi:acetolactate synthase I/II/III large subunit
LPIINEGEGRSVKLSDYVASFIVQQGVKQVFLLPGGGCMHLIDSIGKESRLHYVACLHEQTATIAADAYAQYTRNLGVALVTTGPGSTNAITGVAGSWVESVPVLIVSGQVKTADIKPSPDMRMLGFQEVDITPMVQPVTKYAVTVHDPMTIRYHLEKAVFLARCGRPGPAWINIPLDIQAYVIEPEKLLGFSATELTDRFVPEREPLADRVNRVLELLLQAHRPVIIAGYGVKLSNSEELFLRLAERLGIPVLTTWKACDLLADDHPLFFGRPGVLAPRGANFTQQNSDFVLALGARLDFGQIGYVSETFARAAKKVIVDIDSLELSKFKFPVDVPICASVSDFLQVLECKIAGITLPIWSTWIQRCQSWKQQYPVVTAAYRAQTHYVNSYVLVEALSKAMTSEDLLVPGSSGACSDVCLQSFKVKHGQRILNSPGIGAMGFGLPHTIGACLASDRRRVICVNGDGGFQLNIQDLETVHRLGLPVKYFILNNGGYGSMRATHQNYFQGRLVASDPSSGLTLPDIRRIGDAYRIPNNRITNHAELETRIAEALSTDGPFISEVMIDPAELTAPKVKSVLGANGQMISKPQEDLAPFLDRKEFLENMLIPPLPDYETIV